MSKFSVCHLYFIYSRKTALSKQPLLYNFRKQQPLYSNWSITFVLKPPKSYFFILTERFYESTVFNKDDSNLGNPTNRFSVTSAPLERKRIPVIHPHLFLIRFNPHGVHCRGWGSDVFCSYSLVFVAPLALRW